MFEIYCALKNLSQIWILYINQMPVLFPFSWKKRLLVNMMPVYHTLLFEMSIAWASSFKVHIACAEDFLTKAARSFEWRMKKVPSISSNVCVCVCSLLRYSASSFCCIFCLNSICVSQIGQTNVLYKLLLGSEANKKMKPLTRHA